MVEMDSCPLCDTPSRIIGEGKSMVRCPNHGMVNRGWKILHLTLKRKWFDLIKTGTKKEEYREIKQYWIDRFIDWNTGKFRDWDIIKFKNGYRKDSPVMCVEFKGIHIGKLPEPFPDAGKDVYIISLGGVLYCEEKDKSESFDSCYSKKNGPDNSDGVGWAI